MTNYKIIASDLDETLLNNKSEISPENIEAIKELNRRGVFFVPCTGRSFSELPESVAGIPEIRYVISSTGAAIDDRKTGERILECIGNKKIKNILDVLFTYDMHLSYRKDGKIYVDARQTKEQDFEYYDICKPHINVVKNYAVYLDNFKEECYKSDNIEAMAVFFHDEKDLSECSKKIEAIGGLSIVSPWDNLEIMSSGAGKGKALIALAKRLGVGEDETISIGDSDNDISMLESAALGLVVSNGKDSVKKIADKVICSNEEHAVKYVLEHFYK